MEIQKICIRQCTGSKRAQPDLGAFDAPRSGSSWRKGATKSINLEVLMERLSTHVTTSLRRDLARKFFGAFQAFRLQAKVNGVGKFVRCELFARDWIGTGASLCYHGAPERLVSKKGND
jgi:hypothetical protein